MHLRNLVGVKRTGEHVAEEIEENLRSIQLSFFPSIKLNRSQDLVVCLFDTSNSKAVYLRDCFKTVQRNYLVKTRVAAQSEVALSEDLRRLMFQ